MDAMQSDRSFDDILAAVMAEMVDVEANSVSTFETDGIGRAEMGQASNRRRMFHIVASN